MSAKIRILIADDHLVVRIGLVSILRRERGFEIVGEAGNGLEAINLAEKLKPDVIIMDMMMTKADGCTATIEILKKQPEAKILVLTTFGASTEVKRALEAGAIGAIVKDESHEHLILAIRDAAEGKRYVSPEISRALESSAILPRISDRQKEILQMIAKGFDYPEISRLLGITTDGVKSHMRIVFEKLAASSRSEAVAIALQNRLINP